MHEQCQTVFHTMVCLSLLSSKQCIIKQSLDSRAVLQQSPADPGTQLFLGDQKILVFCTNHNAGHPRFYRVKALGSLQFSSEHNLDSVFVISKITQVSVSVISLGCQWILCNLCTPRLSIGQHYGPILNRHVGRYISQLSVAILVDILANPRSISPLTSVTRLSVNMSADVLSDSQLREC